MLTPSPESLEEARKIVRGLVTGPSLNALVAEVALALDRRAERARREAAEWKPTHRHYKGGLYRVRDIRDEANWDKLPSPYLEGWVLYENEAGELIKRRYTTFHGSLPDGRKRFDPILSSLAPGRETL